MARRHSRRPDRRRRAQRRHPAGCADDRRDAANGSLRASSPASRRLASTKSTLAATGRPTTEANGGPFSAAIDVAPVVNPHSLDYSRQSRRRRYTCDRRSQRRQEHLRGTGCGDRHSARTWSRSLGRGCSSSSSSGETGADAAGGSRASAYVLFRNALKEASELRRYAPSISAARQPDEEIDRPIVRNPNESREYRAGRPAERGRAADALRRGGVGAGVCRGGSICWSMSSGRGDILNVLDLKRDFPLLKLVLVGATEGWLVADKIAASRSPGHRIGRERSAFELRAAGGDSVQRRPDAAMPA